MSKFAKNAQFTKDSRLRNVCVTTWRKDGYRHKLLEDIFADPRVKYICRSPLEACPETGKEHYHLYLELNTTVSLPVLRRLIDSSSAHFEKRNGSPSQARTYCTRFWLNKDLQKIKAEYTTVNPQTDKIEELGVMSRQGSRNDIIALKNAIDSGLTEYELWESFPREYLKYSRHIRRVMYLRDQKRVGDHQKMNVIVLHGDSRTGKTRWAKDKFGYQNVFSPKWNGTKFWFDGYSGQKVLLLNEITGDNVPLPVLQDLLDNYITQQEVKGGFIVSNWDTIVITSNIHPEEWWNSYEKYNRKERKSMYNRITSTIEIGESDDDLSELDWGKKAERPSITLSTSVQPSEKISPEGKKKKLRKNAAVSPKEDSSPKVPEEVWKEEETHSRIEAVGSQDKYSRGSRRSAHS